MIIYYALDKIKKKKTSEFPEKTKEIEVKVKDFSKEVKQGLNDIKQEVTERFILGRVPIPPQRGYADDFTGAANTKYMEQVKMAQYYGATIIDLRGESGICRDFQADTLGDLLHPNKVGNDLYARNVIKRVEASYMDVEDMNQNE